MAAANVQASNGNSNVSASTVVTTGITTTAGNFAIIGVAWDDGTARTCTVGDNKGNGSATAWAAGKIKDTRNNQGMEIFYLQLTSGGASHTFTATFSAAVPSSRIVVHECSGIATSTPEDKNASNIAGNGTSGTTGSVTPTTSGQYLFAQFNNDSGTTTDTFSAGTDFTEPTNATAAAANNELASEYYVQPSAAAHDGLMTKSGGATDWMSSMCTFKAAAAGGAATIGAASMTVMGVQ